MKRWLPIPVLLLVQLVACVGDDVPLSSSSSSSGGSSGETSSSGAGGSSGEPGSSGAGGSSGEPGSSGAGGSSGASSGGSSGELCPAGFADCDGDATNGCEVDVRSNAEHCGSCGRACGGAALCSARECTAETLASELPRPFGLEISPTRAAWIQQQALSGCRTAACTPTILHDLSSDDGFDPFFSSQQLAAVEGDLFFSRCTQGARDCGVARCKMDGCRIGTPPFLASAQEDRRARVLVAGPGAIYTFSNVLGQGFQRTALTDGATSQPPVGYDDFFQDVFVDDQHIVYVDNATNLLNHDGGLYRCPAAGCVGTPRTRLLPPPILHLAVAEGIAYVSSGVERSLGSIVSCAVTGCVDAEVTLATAQPYVSSIAADATDVYWTTMGTATPQSNVAAIGKVMRCRLPTCAGGPVVVADNLVNPVSVRIDQTYVYWLTYGYASLSTGQLSRRRR